MNTPLSGFNNHKKKRPDLFRDLHQPSRAPKAGYTEQPTFDEPRPPREREAAQGTSKNRRENEKPGASLQPPVDFTWKGFSQS